MMCSSVQRSPVYFAGLLLLPLTILLPGFLGCSTSTTYVPLNSRVSQVLDHLDVEVDMSNEIDFMGSRLQGWSREPAFWFGLAGYLAAQSGREAADAKIAKEISAAKETDLVALLMKRLQEDFVNTGRVRSVQTWKKGSGEPRLAGTPVYLGVTIPSWGLKQIRDDGGLKSYMEAILDFDAGKSLPRFSDQQTITVDHNRTLDDYRKDGNLLLDDLTLMVETASKRIVSLVIN